MSFGWMQRISSVCRSGIQACNPVSGLAFLFFMAANDAMHRIGASSCATTQLYIRFCIFIHHL